MLFAMWRNDLGPRLSPAQWAAFDASVQELKYQATIKGSATGSEAIDEAMREAVNGLKVHDAILLGLRARLERFNGESAEIDKIISTNTRLKTRPDDTASAAYLDSVRRGHTERRDKIRADIQKTEEQIASVENPLR